MGKLVTENYRVASKKLPGEFDGVKIAYLSDLHNVSFGRENEELLARLRKEGPDYVFVGGDMVVGARDFEPEALLRLFQRISEYWPVYLGLGNHEQKLMSYEETRESMYPAYIEEIKSFGITILDNQSILLNRGSEKLRLYGLTMDYKYYGKKWKKVTMEAAYLKELLGDCGQEEFSVLLSHNPKYFEAYASWGADLVLSGHVHGGIIIFPHLGGLIAPDYTFFPKYDSGYFRLGDSQMVVSRGLGSHTIKLRVFNKPEISLITLCRDV